MVKVSRGGLHHESKRAGPTIIGAETEAAEFVVMADGAVLTEPNEKEGLKGVVVVDCKRE